MNNWLAKNESYVNPRTAQVIRLRTKQIEDARRRVEKDVALPKTEDETEAERLIRRYRIKVQPPEQNCGPQMVDLCTQERAFASYKKRPNINKMLEGPTGPSRSKRDQAECEEVVHASKAILNDDKEERERLARKMQKEARRSSSALDPPTQQTQQSTQRKPKESSLGSDRDHRPFQTLPPALDIPVDNIVQGSSPLLVQAPRQTNRSRNKSPMNALGPSNHFKARNQSSQDFLPIPFLKERDSVDQSSGLD